jgi:hypothetical protein
MVRGETDGCLDVLQLALVARCGQLEQLDRPLRLAVLHEQARLTAHQLGELSVPAARIE